MSFLHNKHSRARKIILLLTVCFSSISVSISAQEQRIVFPDVVISIEDGFSEIQKQTDFLISSDHSGFDVSKKVRLKNNTLKLSSALNQLLYKSKRGYLIHGNHILIVPQKAVPIVPENPDQRAIEQIHQQELSVIEKTFPEIDLTKPPVDTDSLEKALLSRKVEYPAENPSIPSLNKRLYYDQRDSLGKTTGVSHYTGSMPSLALRTNLLYDFGALTPNLGVELGLGRRSTLLMSGSYNGWNKDGKENDGKRLNHWVVEAEYRQWLCERFNGHFFGAHAFYGYYNVSQYDIPFMFGEKTKDYRYKGSVYGVGVSYGYQHIVSKHWNLEFNLGVGVGMTNYDKWDCARCGDAVAKDLSHTFFAPTKLGISLVYIIK